MTTRNSMEILCRIFQSPNNLNIAEVYFSPLTVTRNLSRQKFNSFRVYSVQQFSSSESKEEIKTTEPPLNSFSDWIGPIDKKSSLRKRRFSQPKDESPSERNLRLQKQETHEWNQAFWSKQNEEFVRAKETYIQKMIQKNGGKDEPTDGIKQVLTPEQMADFYTKFLADNRTVFRDYNREWYKKNLTMLWPSLKVAAYRMLKRRRKSVET